ncbi:MAG: AAA family ATPase, partial [Pseudomonadota bacterium]
QAGTGKSYLLQALNDELQRNDIKPEALAPTAAASRGSLREAGLTDANTVAKFLGPSETGQQLRNDAKDGVIVLDEAGLASTPQMLRLLKFADKLNARVVLVGDTRQMTAVERGDALRLLEEKAGLVPAELKHIRRQKDPVYRQVVEQLANGEAEKGLEDADKAGFVHEVETDDGPQFVADWVVEQRKQGSVIVMCPVHAEGRKASEAIRRTLQKEGLVQPDQVTMPVLRQANLVEADLSDAPHTLQAGDQAIMRRDDRKRGLAAGETLIAVADERGQIHLHRQMEEDGVEKMTRIEEGLHPQAFAVYRQATIPVAVGDTLRAREAIEDAAMQRGDFATVKRIDEARRTIEFEDGRSVSMDSQKLDHGYYTTPNSGQGLSARAVCFYAPSHALPA